MIVQQLQALVNSLGLTAYGISQVIAAETDPTSAKRAKIRMRWQRWPNGQGLKTLLDLEGDLNSLGYEIKIQKIEIKQNQ